MTLTVSACITGTDGCVGSDASCTVTAPGGRGNGATPHAVGATLTYLKRYALGLVVPIGTDEDDDHGAGAPAPKDASKQRQPESQASKPASKMVPLNSIVKSARLFGELKATSVRELTELDQEIVRGLCSQSLQIEVKSVGSLTLAQLHSVAADLKGSRPAEKADDPESDVPF